MVSILLLLDPGLSVALYFAAATSPSVYAIFFILFLLLLLSGRASSRLRALMIFLLIAGIQRYLFGLLWPYWGPAPDVTPSYTFDRVARVFGLFPLYNTSQRWVGATLVTDYAYPVMWELWGLLIAVHI